MTPRERRKLAQHLARYLFHILGGPDRVAAKHGANGWAGPPDVRGEVEGCGLGQVPMAGHLEAELGRYVLAARKAKRAKGRK